MRSASGRASNGNGCRSWPTGPAARPSSRPTSRELTAEYQKILDELRRRYAVGYQSSNGARNGKFRKVVIRVTQQDATVRSRGGYFAPPQ